LRALHEGRVNMKSVKVKELMVPVAEYATVFENATLYEAVLALEEARESFDRERDKHRAVLVLDTNNRTVGKLSIMDVVRSLEPKYEEIGDLNAISRLGFTPEFVKSMLRNYGLWEKPLQDICRKAASKKIKAIMQTPTEGEYVSEEASLNEAIHLLVMGNRQSLLVKCKEEIVGILRLSDVFAYVRDVIKACNL
jgi:CBS domain containing-hemolysin-like protein